MLWTHNQGLNFNKFAQMSAEICFVRENLEQRRTTPCRREGCQHTEHVRRIPRGTSVIHSEVQRR